MPSSETKFLHSSPTPATEVYKHLYAWTGLETRSSGRTALPAPEGARGTCLQRSVMPLPLLALTATATQGKLFSFDGENLSPIKLGPDTRQTQTRPSDVSGPGVSAKSGLLPSSLEPWLSLASSPIFTRASK